MQYRVTVQMAGGGGGGGDGSKLASKHMGDKKSKGGTNEYYA